MSIILSELKSNLRPYILKHIPGSSVDLLSDDDFLNIFKYVANDLNEHAQLHVERWKNSLGSVTSEDDNYTNYLMNGNILKVLYFKYTGADWETQDYTYVDDRIVLKTTLSGEADADIIYLRRCEDLEEEYDQVDLPDSVINDYLELLKIRLRIDYGDEKLTSYEQALEFYSQKAKSKIKHPMIDGFDVQRRWMWQTGDDTLYDITDHYISLDNFIADVNGDYTYVGS